MTQPDKDKSPKDSDPAFISEAKGLLEEIKSLKAKAEEDANAAEAARKKADSESLFAFNAKVVCESHSTAISGLKGSVESDVGAIQASKQKLEEALASVSANKVSAENDQKQVAERSREVNRLAEELLSASQSGASYLSAIEASRTSAENSAQQASTAGTSAAVASSAVEQLKRSVEAVKDEADELLQAISASEKNGKQLTESIAALLLKAQESDVSLAAVWDHLKKSDELARTNEDRIANHSRELDNLTNRIEALLPGATSAGLASSFNAQKARFQTSQTQWIWTFGGCIALLVLIALPSFFATMGIPIFGHQLDPSWNGTWRSFALRLPIVLPLVWLAVYAGRNYMLSLRLEEDYAYKEAISTAFEGYKREMEQIAAGELTATSPVNILCANVLNAISERPGRMYEGKHTDINLMTEARNALEKGADLSRRKIAGSE
jgi:hypothetical protein